MSQPIVRRQAAAHTQTGAGTAHTFGLSDLTGIHKIRVMVEVEDAPTGTNPTLDFAVDWSVTGNQFAQFTGETALTQQTAQGAAVDELTVAGRYLRLTPTVGGTATPTFTNVIISIIA